MVLFLARDDKSKPRSAHRRLPFSDSFFLGSKRFFLRRWQPHMWTAYSLYVDKCDERYFHFPPEVIEGLPDHLLTEVLHRLHPTDRVHGASLVCKRWNRLSYAEGVWTEAAVLNIEKERINCAKTFLQKVSASLKKLYIAKTSCRIVDILPASLPHVTFCELESHPFDNESSLRYPSDLIYVDRCMPNLRTLVVMAVPLVVDCYRERPDEVDLGLLSSANAFGQLQSLALHVLSSVVGYISHGITVVNTERFLSERPNLEQLRIAECVRLRSEGNSAPTSVNFGKLKGLSLWACFIVDENRDAHMNMDVSLLSRLQPTSLVFVEIFVYFPLLSLHALRELHNLEHLHFYASKSWLRVFNVVELFAAPLDPSHFPNRLKYLRIDDIVTSGWEVAQIAKSCRELRSLNCGCRGVNGSAIDVIAKSLSHLRILVIDYLYDLVAKLEAADDPGAVFPELRFVSAFGYRPQCRRVHHRHSQTVAAMRSLFTKRPDLVVEVDRRFISYRSKQTTGFRLNGNTKDRDGRLWEAMRMEEGWCCVRDRKYFYPLDSDADDEYDRAQYGESPIEDGTDDDLRTEDRTQNDVLTF